MGTRGSGSRMLVFLIHVAHSLLRRLSNKSRLEMTNGRITTLISADASYLVSGLAVQAAPYGHANEHLIPQIRSVATLELMRDLAGLVSPSPGRCCHNGSPNPHWDRSPHLDLGLLGPRRSCCAPTSLLVSNGDCLTLYCTDPHDRCTSTMSVSLPLNHLVASKTETFLTLTDSHAPAWMFAKMLSYRSTQQSHVDTRVRLISEVINHIRAVKLYGYQTHYAQAVSGLRWKELEELRRSGFVRAAMAGLLVRAAMAGLGYLIPTLAAVSEWGYVLLPEFIREEGHCTGERSC
jgi:hypothetical protein